MEKEGLNVRLTTVTRLLAVVTTLTLREERGL